MALELHELRENLLTREMDELMDLPDHDPIDWHRNALCAQEPYWGTDIWFAEVSCKATMIPKSAMAKEADAAALCWTCPVRKECLKYATDTEQPHGTWGGLPIALIKIKKYNYDELIDEKNPFETDDPTSMFHPDNLRNGRGRPKKRKDAA